MPYVIRLLWKIMALLYSTGWCELSVWISLPLNSQGSTCPFLPSTGIKVYANHPLGQAFSLLIYWWMICKTSHSWVYLTTGKRTVVSKRITPRLLWPWHCPSEYCLWDARDWGHSCKIAVLGCSWCSLAPCSLGNTEYHLRVSPGSFHLLRALWSCRA